ncbi:MAG: GAF domain-containing protein [Acidobacteriales bacterium]|nr:GAF domain-containing protein [Terriglobales bacterium]
MTSRSHTPAVSAVPKDSRIDVQRFLLDLADALNTTLDLDTLLRRIAELVKNVISFEIFAILLLNERTQDLRLRFSIGHTPEVERIRIRIGHGITGQAVALGEPILVNDVRQDPHYINGHPDVRSELAVPLVAKNKVIGVIDIQSLEPDYFKPEHSQLLSLVASRIAVAIENARLYSRVAKQAQTLQTLNEISRELTSILDLDPLFARIGELLRRLFEYQMFSILILDENTQTLQHRFAVRYKENIQLKHDVPIGKGLVGSAAALREPVLAPDVARDPRYIMLNPETRSELCVPLIYKDKVIGVLDLENTRRGYFNEEHVRTLSTAAAQIAVAVENARLYERIAREEKRLERDLKMASEVQQHLLPPCCPSLPSAEFAAKFEPARTIGGDIYDFIPYSGGRMGIFVGDVSGKGAPAALFAALVAGILRSMASMEPTPSEMLSAINTSLLERRIESHYVAAIYAIWDDEHHVMTVSNSGQPRPIYCHHGKTQVVESTGLPLGLMDDAEYDEITIHAHPGDIFVFFSDGLLDAMNAKEEFFGRNRLEEIVRKHHERSADDIVTAIFDAVNKHSKGMLPFDDETAVVMKVKPDALDTVAIETARRRQKKTSPALRNV